MSECCALYDLHAKRLNHNGEIRTLSIPKTQIKSVYLNGPLSPINDLHPGKMFP